MYLQLPQVILEVRKNSSVFLWNMGIKDRYLQHGQSQVLEGLLYQMRRDQ